MNANLFLSLSLARKSWLSLFTSVFTLSISTVLPWSIPSIYLQLHLLLLPLFIFPRSIFSYCCNEEFPMRIRKNKRLPQNDLSRLLRQHDQTIKGYRERKNIRMQ